MSTCPRSVWSALLCGVAALMALITLTSCAQNVPLAELTQPYAPDECGACAGWNEPQEPFNIHGNTWYVGTRGLASILITSDTGHVLIDGGLPDSAPLILDNISALGFDVDDIGLILHSHPHFDHAGGIAALQQVTGARVAAPAAGAEVEEVSDRVPVRLGNLELVYADSQTPVSADGFRFTGSAGLPAFERGFQALESMSCDILVTPYPSRATIGGGIPYRQSG